MSLRTVLSGLLALFLALGAGAAPPASVLKNDGPYVLWRDKEAMVLEVRDGVLKSDRLKPPYNLQVAGLPALRLSPKPYPPPQDIFPQPARVAAVADIHGNRQGLIALLQAHGVIDKQLRWSYGRGHLVVLGDVMDRGAEVTETLWLVRAWGVQAEAGGGRVHFLNGNHETMVLRGDLRYLHPKYSALKAVLGMDQMELYGFETDLGRWLRSRPVILRLGQLLFIHAGISLPLWQKNLDIPAINAAFRMEMLISGSPFMLAGEGPLWYRGFVTGGSQGQPEIPTEAIQAMLDRYQASIMVVGHTPLPGITACHGDRVYAIDAGLGEERPGELWLWEGGDIYQGTADGKRKRLRSVSETSKVARRK